MQMNFNSQGSAAELSISWIKYELDVLQVIHLSAQLETLHFCGPKVTSFLAQSGLKEHEIIYSVYSFD